ncbi:MAG: Queuosine Biosynthesis QueE Radical SAM [Ignavibacteriae bacterium]|nr:MAG: Queuosine Biosynthesis QueE Radical SAM [Ignavibacteriota bacterium]
MKITYTKENSLIVNEIFYSIQGESTHAGRPCVFIRLTYCNLRCTYCDTEYAFEEGKEITIETIFKQIQKYNCKLVEITGGEPLLQKNVHSLITLLCDNGYEVLLETGGSIDISDVDQRVKIILDIKCPSSGMSKKNYWKNLSKLKPIDEVKFVICDRNDFKWAVDKILEYNLTKKCTVLMSPVVLDSASLKPSDLAKWILKSQLPVRMQIQLHKIIWGINSRGV